MNTSRGLFLPHKPKLVKHFRRRLRFSAQLIPSTLFLVLRNKIHCLLTSTLIPRGVSCQRGCSCRSCRLETTLECVSKVLEESDAHMRARAHTHTHTQTIRSCSAAFCWVVRLTRRRKSKYSKKSSWLVNYLISNLYDFLLCGGHEMDEASVLNVIFKKASIHSVLELISLASLL